MAGFEGDLKELEGIVDKLERGELTLEESVTLFEEGVKLSAACKAELEQAEGRVQILMEGKGRKMQAVESEAEQREQEFGVEVDGDEE